MNEVDLETYGNILHKVNYEGLDYYVTSYASEADFVFDPELQEMFRDAKTALNRFVSILHKRVKAAGGDPDDYEA